MIRDGSDAPAAPSEPSGPAPINLASSQPAVLSCSGLRKAFGERLAVDGVGFWIGRDET